MNHRSILLGFLLLPLWMNESGFAKPHRLLNPMSVQYLEQNLRPSQPRLVLTPANEKRIREKLRSDPIIQSIYKAIQHDAENVLQRDLIHLKTSDDPRSQQNQLGISRDFLHRINVLAMVYRLEKDPRVLERINDEVVAVCRFPSWNPRHFLDVAEMSLAVALALDWTAGALPESTISLAKASLIAKGIQPSWPHEGETPDWVTASHNWNQVCNGGMIAASIAVAEVEPELAAKTIRRSLDGLNHALAAYAPDGAYPEGAVYWGYGTMFSVVTAAMLESAFGTDFGMAASPGFMESAMFRIMSEAPSKRLFNYGDCAERPERYTDFTLAWFAARTGNSLYLNEERFMRAPEQIGRMSRLAGAGLVWTAQYERQKTGSIPQAWKADGANPLVVLGGGKDDPNGYYLAGKGGRGAVNHGNMDGGSFVFELKGVRWVVDPGNQNYGVLERAGFDLWELGQDSDRWTLLTKNNFGHSTLSVNNQLHRVDGMSVITDFKDGEHPEASIEMTPAFKGLLKSARRRFVKDSPVSLVIEDRIQTVEETELVTWQLMTTADVEILDGGALLTKDGKKLKLENLSHSDVAVSVVSLYPPPSKFDKPMKGMKRLEIRLPASAMEGGKTKIAVRLSAM